MPTQSVTKSSHYVSVQQTSSSVGGGTSSSRYLSWTVGGRSHYFCSLPGILRIIEILLIIIVVIMARVGNTVNPFGSTDADFTGIGGSIFLLIILLMFTISTLIGHFVPALLEVMTTLVGAVLMITAGALAVTFYTSQYRQYKHGSGTGTALGVIAIIAGVVLLVDFVLSARKMRVSIS